ncbi:MAG: DUF2478 domain-containing protein [Pseudomonadota bacterium]
MRLAYTMTDGRRELDPLLHEVALGAIAAGRRVAGIVQVNRDVPGSERCDMDAVVLPDGPTIRISQSLGPAARGCRLDPDGLEAAVAAAAARLEDGADLLIVNKFGKHEASGRGFRPLIAVALERGADVLVGVNHLNVDALTDFSGGLAHPLPPNPLNLMHWIEARGPSDPLP